MPRLSKRWQFSELESLEFKRFGVVDDFFIMDPDASPVAAVIHVDPQTGGRTIFYMAKRYHLLKAADIPLDVVRRAKLVLVDGYERDAAPTVLEAVREVGGRRLWGRFPWSVWRRAFRRTAVAQPDGTGSLGRCAGCARARRAESPAHSWQASCRSGMWYRLERPDLAAVDGSADC
jgi:hypothetical protein